MLVLTVKSFKTNAKTIKSIAKISHILWNHFSAKKIEFENAYHTNTIVQAQTNVHKLKKTIKFKNLN